VPSPSTDRCRRAALGRTTVFAIAVLALFALAGCRDAARDQARARDGCVEAVAARTEAVTAIDASLRQAEARNAARAAQLRAIADEARRELAAAADLRPCDDATTRTGVVVDLADLRERYRVVIDRTSSRLSDTAAQPIVEKKGKGKDNSGH
jgi:hypothetical protein